MTTTAQAVVVQPNVFDLQGYNTQISYSSTSFTGAAELTYVSDGVTLKFRGDDIRTERNHLGQMVSVRINGNAAAIGPVESLSLIIPQMTLSTETRQGDIQTIAVLSLRSVPGKLPSQTQYLPLCVAGIARQIDF
jgi:hypothetical protein